MANGGRIEIREGRKDEIEYKKGKNGILYAMLITSCPSQPDVPFQQCVTPKFERGHCRYLQHCIQPEFVNNFNVFLRYVCFIEGV